MFEGKEVVVFDLDGTLVELELDWEAIRKKLAGIYANAGFTRSETAHTVLITEKIAKVLGHEHKKAADIMVRDFEKSCGVTPIEATIAIARQARGEGKRLAILSNNCHGTIEDCLAGEGIREMFDFIVGKEDVEGHKPKPEGLHLIMKHFGVPKGKVVFIGNEKVDEAAAKAAGVDFVMV
jgi:phosphoglycolate phosphatase